MAVVRPSRNAPPVALITFVFLFLVSAGLAIFFGLLWAQVSKINDDKDRDLSNLIHLPSERTILSDTLAGNPKDSAVGALNKQVRMLRELVGGPGGLSASVDGLAASGRKAASLGNSTSLIAACNALNEDNANMKSEIASLTDQNRVYKERMAGLQGPFNTSMQSSASEISKLQQQLKDSTDDVAKAKAEGQQNVDDTQKAADAKQRANDQIIRDQINIRQQLEDQNATLRQTLHDLREPPIKNNENPILWQPDGKIIKTPIGVDEVWINIGRKDRLRPNVTFSVYDPKLGVGSGPDGRGRGAIEVIEVGETESRARITHVEPGEKLTDGDLVANVVFNKIGTVSEGPYKEARAKVYKFYVFGDFDLDGDGISTPSERDHVIRMIESWGGEVVDKMDSQTDFLIIGTEPLSATGNLPAVTDQTADMEAKKKAEIVEYAGLLKAAKDNAIPILDANRFFAYIGYYNNTIVGAKTP